MLREVPRACEIRVRQARLKILSPQRRLLEEKPSTSKAYSKGVLLGSSRQVLPSRARTILIVGDRLFADDYHREALRAMRAEH